MNHSARSGGVIGINFQCFNMKVYCVFSLESPYRGNSNENTEYTILILKKNNENRPKLS